MPAGCGKSPPLYLILMSISLTVFRNIRDIVEQQIEVAQKKSFLVFILSLKSVCLMMSNQKAQLIIVSITI